MRNIHIPPAERSSACDLLLPGRPRRPHMLAEYGQRARGFIVRALPPPRFSGEGWGGVIARLPRPHPCPSPRSGEGNSPQYLTLHPYGCVEATLTGLPASSSVNACVTYCVASAMSPTSADGTE